MSISPGSGSAAAVLGGERGDDGVPSDDDLSLAGATPSAPHSLAGSWWKYDVVRTVLDKQPGRRVVCIDDESTQDSAFTA